MSAFETLHGRALTWLEADVDTDVIFPARFLLIMEKAGLGRYLFHDRRAAALAAGAHFPLDYPALAGAPILIAGENFGCGSSREQAVWALRDAGFGCVIAPSFGEIFHANSINNGLLPIRLEADPLSALTAAAQAGARFSVDLDAQAITCEPEGGVTRFAVEPAAREALLAGWDEIEVILRGHGEAIDRYERAHRASKPWLFA